jgi:cysteine desulfurase
LTVYFDHNATTPLRPEARQAIDDAMGPPSNPSSVHSYGQSARHLIEEARRHLAELINARPEEIIFTSGGTEANAMALMREVPQVITTAIEHTSILDAVPDAVRVGVKASGVVDLEAMTAAAASAPEGSLISVMMANNETGVIQPLGEVVQIAKAHGHLTHSDSVQAPGKIGIDFAASGLDMMTVSAHKIGGPAGAGALVQREGLASFPRSFGGGQEKNRRPGTENLLGITGFGAAASVASAGKSHFDMLREAHRQLEATLLEAAPDATVFGSGSERLPNTTCIAMPGKGSEMQVMAFDLDGIALSAGAACSSGKVEASHVLAAMSQGAENQGADDIACAVRISSGWNTAQEDFDRLAETWIKLYKQG